MHLPREQLTLQAAIFLLCATLLVVQGNAIGFVLVAYGALQQTKRASGKKRLGKSC